MEIQILKPIDHRIFRESFYFYVPKHLQCSQSSLR